MKNFVFDLQRFAATLTQYNVYELNDGSDFIAMVTVDSSNKLTVKNGGDNEISANSDGTYTIGMYKLTLTAENGRLKSASLTLMGGDPFN